MEVAWNIVKMSRLPPSERKRIKTEVKLLRDIEHKNVIKVTPSRASNVFFAMYIITSFPMSFSVFQLLG